MALSSEKMALYSERIGLLDVEDIPEEYVEHCKNEAATSIQSYLTRQLQSSDTIVYVGNVGHSLDFSDIKRYDSTFIIYFNTRKWDSLREEIKSRPTYDISKFITHPALENIYSALFHWESMYRNGDITLDECMFGLYMEYIELTNEGSNDMEEFQDKAGGIELTSTDADKKIDHVTTKDLKDMIANTNCPEAKKDLEKALALMEQALEKNKSLSQKLTALMSKYPDQDVLAQFVKYDDVSKLLNEDTDLARTLLNDIIKSNIDNDVIAIRILQQLEYCSYPETKDMVLECFSKISKYHLYIFDFFPDYFEEKKLDASKVLKRILENPDSSITKAFIYGPDRSSDNYVEDRIYLFDNKRENRFNILMGYEYIGEETTTTYHMRQNRNKQIQGTAYAELVKDGPV